ncbi:MAG: hypothetical protein PHY45_12175 [Rhodocyclaceae bacterium]|nr:hypothetical protein [Rhodocyclaceae bacterium]
MEWILRPVALPPELLGRPAPCDLFNARGVLLLKAAAPIDARRGQAAGPLPIVYCRAGEAGKVSGFNPLAELQQAAQALARIDARLGRGEHVAPGEIARLGRDVHAAWSLDADACLGYARLCTRGRPSILHVVHAALIAAELGAAVRLNDGQIADIVGAALTMNLADLRLHDDMHGLAAGPGAAVAAGIRAHPLASLALLERIGAFGKTWTDAVGGHHENIDGSGYPHRLRGAEIALAARIVRVADTFAARLTGRKSRQPLHWNLRRTADLQDMARHVFGNDQQRLDRSLASRLLTVAGRFPPGSLVRLDNNELAVVARRRPGPPVIAHDMFAIADAQRRPLDPPQRRRVGRGALAIRNYSNDEGARLASYPWQKVWGYGEPASPSLP